MPGPAYLTGDRMTLRTVESADIEFVHRHWNQPSIRRQTYWKRPRSRDDVAAFLDGRDDPHFLICRDADPVGFAWLMDVDDVSGHADVGYWIAEDDRGNGYATEALELVVEYAFADRGLRRLYARVFEGNDASMHVLEKSGFESEGCLRDHYRVRGEYVDAHLYGLNQTDR